MPILEESWQPIADSLGFKDEKAMLMSLYNEDGFSINEISKIIGYAAWSVRRRLIMHGIKLRGRGGPNNLGKRALLQVDDDKLFHTGAGQLAMEYKISTATVFAERRLRRSECSSVSSAPMAG